MGVGGRGRSEKILRPESSSVFRAEDLWGAWLTNWPREIYNSFIHRPRDYDRVATAVPDGPAPVIEVPRPAYLSEGGVLK